MLGSPTDLLHAKFHMESFVFRKVWYGSQIAVSFHFHDSALLVLIRHCLFIRRLSTDFNVFGFKMLFYCLALQVVDADIKKTSCFGILRTNLYVNGKGVGEVLCLPGLLHLFGFGWVGCATGAVVLPMFECLGVRV